MRRIARLRYLPATDKTTTADPHGVPPSSSAAGSFSPVIPAPVNREAADC